MNLLYLSRISIAACLAGLLALLAVTLTSAERMWAKQEEVSGLLHLRERTNDLAAASQDIVLFGADPQLWRAFQDEARATGAQLQELGDDHPDARKAVRRIALMVQSVETALDQRGDAEPAGGGLNPLEVPERGRIVVNQVAGHGIALDTALDELLRLRQREIARGANWIGGTLAGSALLFGMICVIAFALIHRRIAAPARALSDTLKRIRAGDLDARAPVTGSDELTELARTLNDLVEHRQRVDGQMRAQQAELERRDHMLSESQRMARVGSWRYDAVHDQLEWSAETYRIVGVAPESFFPTAQAVLERIHPDDRGRLQAAREAVMQGQRSHDIEYRLVRPDGEVRHLHERGEPEFDADGRLRQISGTAQDVTELRRRDERLRQYRQLVEASDDLIALVDRQGRFVLVNRAYAERHGDEAEQIEGRRLEEVLPASFHRQTVRPALERALAGEAQQIDTEREYPGLGRRNVLARYHPILAPDGRVSHVGVVISDITEIKRAERALREQSRLLEIAGRTSRLGGWSIDLDNWRAIWSEVTCEIHGMPHGYSPTVDEAIDFYAPGRDRDRIREVFDACVERGEPFDEELQIIAADGERKWVRAIGESAHDADGRVVRIEGGFQDISERRRLDERLHQYLKLIESSSDLFAVVDADLRYALVNRAYADIHGRERAEIEGSRPALLLGPDYFERVWRPLLERALAGEPQQLETDFEYPNAGQRHLLERFYPIERRTGDPASVGIVITDVTEQKEAEAALARSRDQLAGLLETRKALINSLPAHIAVLDSAANILDVNDQWRHFGKENEYGAEHFGVGLNYLEVCDGASGDCADEAAEVAHGLREVLAGEREVFALEYPCHAPDEERWFRVMVNRLLPAEIDEEDLGAVVMHVNITERKLAERELGRIAYQDQLTGLLSRNGFVQALADRLGDGADVAGGLVVILDVQGQRDVNDAHGYDVGDHLLRELGQRLSAGAGADGIVGRIGGDEFALYLPPRAGRDPEERIAEAAANVERPFRLDELAIEISGRFGYTVLEGRTADVNQLLRQAELALFHSRTDAAETGRSWAAYSDELGRQVHERVELTQELRGALERGELELHFQPKVDLESGRLLSAEALLRWQHPERGLVSPGVFIPVAEQSQLIGPIGDWALRQACRHLREWQDARLEVVRVAVNVSLVQFALGDFATKVRAALDEFGLEPAALSLEITESVFERESEQLRRQVRALHRMGVQLALDDFGTGYSSLLYLQRYPFDEIKIDQGFVRHMLTDRYSHSIVETVMNLSAALGATAVAEGVETPAERDCLLELGCRTGQGYHYSWPLEAEDFRWLLEQGVALPLEPASGESTG